MNSVPRLARRAAAEASSGWSCFFCRRAGAPGRPGAGSPASAPSPTSATAAPRISKTASTVPRSGSGSISGSGSFSAPRRFFSGGASRRQQQQHPQPPRGPQPGARVGGVAPGMDRMSEVYRRRNRTTVYYTLSIILGTVAFSYGSVPMYKMICQTTGWGGQPVRAHGTYTGSPTGANGEDDLAARLEPVTDARRIRVTFSASVSDSLPWKFVPQQREVRVLPGETALAFYTATNASDRDIVGVATYSVAPAQTAPYFSKIQCFCFEEQRLAAGETVDMPVFFYLDPDLLKDINMRNVETVTLNYTFFKARYDENGRFQGAPRA